jgi:hypothetical protein
MKKLKMEVKIRETDCDPLLYRLQYIIAIYVFHKNGFKKNVRIRFLLPPEVSIGDRSCSFGYRLEFRYNQVRGVEYILAIRKALQLMGVSLT